MKYMLQVFAGLSFHEYLVEDQNARCITGQGSKCTVYNRLRIKMYVVYLVEGQNVQCITG